MKAFRLAAFAAIAAFIIGCGSAATPAPQAVEKSLETTEFAYAPKDVEAAAGSPVKITLVNKGILEHDLTIDSLNFKVAVAIGETASNTTGVLTAGTYDFYCSIPGHRESGMIGTLTVK